MKREIRRQAAIGFVQQRQLKQSFAACLLLPVVFQISILSTNTGIGSSGRIPATFPSSVQRQSERPLLPSCNIVLRTPPVEAVVCGTAKCCEDGLRKGSFRVVASSVSRVRGICCYSRFQYCADHLLRVVCKPDTFNALKNTKSAENSHDDMSQKPWGFDKKAAAGIQQVLNLMVPKVSVDFHHAET